MIFEYATGVRRLIDRKNLYRIHSDTNCSQILVVVKCQGILQSYYTHYDVANFQLQNIIVFLLRVLTFFITSSVTTAILPVIIQRC